LVQSQRECMGNQRFTRYDPLENNCQHFAVSALLCLNILLRWNESMRLLQPTENIRPSRRWIVHVLTRPLLRPVRRARVQFERAREWFRFRRIRRRRRHIH
jgi:hypothetical protein